MLSFLHTVYCKKGKGRGSVKRVTATVGSTLAIFRLFRFMPFLFLFGQERLLYLRV